MRYFFKQLICILFNINKCHIFHSIEVSIFKIFINIIQFSKIFFYYNKNIITKFSKILEKHTYPCELKKKLMQRKKDVEEILQH